MYENIRSYSCGNRAVILQILYDNKTRVLFQVSKPLRDLRLGCSHRDSPSPIQPLPIIAYTLLERHLLLVGSGCFFVLTAVFERNIMERKRGGHSVMNIYWYVSLVFTLICYVFILFCMIDRARRIFKFLIYIYSFAGLLMPGTDFISLPYIGIIDFRTYATVIGGMELIDYCIKCYIKGKLEKGKQLSKRLRFVYAKL